MVIVYIGLGIIGIWILAAIFGVGSNTVFKNPQSMSDAQLDRTVRLCGRIMDNSQVFSPSYNKATEKHSAALAEIKRRHDAYIVPIGPKP